MQIRFSFGDELVPDPVSTTAGALGGCGSALPCDDDIVEVIPSPAPASKIALRPYQIQANDALCSPPPGVWRQLLVLATGAGKTVVAADLVHRLIKPGKRCLFLAHRQELINQGAAKIRSYNSDVVVEIEKAEQRANRARHTPAAKPNVVVASVQSLHEKRLAEFDPCAFDLIICDETHHALAAGYKNIFEYFGCFDPERRTALVGVTATPARSDRKKLSTLFQREAYRRDIGPLIIDGYLCEVRAKRVNSQIDLSDIQIVDGDYDKNELADAVDTAERNALIVQAYLKFAAGRKTIVFAASVAHAQRLAELFNANGVKSNAIWGALATDLRIANLDAFRTDSITLISNYNVLLEGFDEPSISCVILARPTRSPNLTLQALGRGTRLFPGKSDLLVLDIQDKHAKNKPMTVAAAFGLPRDFDPENASLAQCASMIQSIDPGMRDKVLDPEALRKIHDRVKAGLDAEDIDILERREQTNAVKDLSFLRWQKSGDGYVLIVGNEKYTIERDGVDALALHWSCNGMRRTHPENFRTEAEAFARWDPLIAQRHEKSARYIRNDQDWIDKPATDKQLFSLFAYGAFKTRDDIPPALTQAEAANLLDVHKLQGSKFVYRRIPSDLRYIRPPREWTGPRHKRKSA